MSRVSPFQPVNYRFRITDYQGNVSELDDVYRFQNLLLSDLDLHLHSEGTNYEGYSSFGAHVITLDGVKGTRFAVWAPNAIVVSVVGNFNDWDSRRHPHAITNWRRLGDLHSRRGHRCVIQVRRQIALPRL